MVVYIHIYICKHDWGILMVNVTIYSSTMDPMGLGLIEHSAFPMDPHPNSWAGDKPIPADAGRTEGSEPEISWLPRRGQTLRCLGDLKSRAAENKNLEK